jgi:hypothetical protein
VTRREQAVEERRKLLARRWSTPPLTKLEWARVAELNELIEVYQCADLATVHHEMEPLRCGVLAVPETFDRSRS